MPNDKKLYYLLNGEDLCFGVPLLFHVGKVYFQDSGDPFRAYIVDETDTFKTLEEASKAVNTRAAARLLEGYSCENVLAACKELYGDEFFTELINFMAKNRIQTIKATLKRSRSRYGLSETRKAVELITWEKENETH